MISPKKNLNKNSNNFNYLIFKTLNTCDIDTKIEMYASKTFQYINHSLPLRYFPVRRVSTEKVALPSFLPPWALFG